MGLDHAHLGQCGVVGFAPDRVQRTHELVNPK
jgi:hypothetical protein